MGLEIYRSKRDFTKSPEPPVATKPVGDPPGDGRLFVVQKHDASRLHYDFRLQLGDVLKSWAVPKGPSLDPDQRRLAVHVEDHPLEYGGFEGVIPKGEYGGGTVMLWDRGEWIPKGDPEAGYRRGKLSFELKGERLRGRWTLVRMSEDGDESENWLLIKARDPEAREVDGAEGGETDSGGRGLLERHRESVVSGRSLEEIARDRDHVWRSSEPGGGPRSGVSDGTRAPAASVRVPDSGSLPGARKRKLPEKVAPQLATPYESPPEGEEWLHEIKFDGYRITCRVVDGEARLLSRSGKDWSDRFAAVARAAERLPGQPLLLDGEVVHPEPDGTTSFQNLQRAIGEGRDADLAYYLFDLLYLGEHDLRRTPLSRRKEALEQLLGASSGGGSGGSGGGDGRAKLRYSEHVTGQGPAFFGQACRFALEGIISKRADGAYRSGRGRNWRKIKCVERETFVVAGYTAPSGARSGFGSLLLGAWDEEGELRYCGRVGTGFDERTLARLHERLESLRLETSPFAAFPDSSRGVTWVAPRLTVEVEFTEWTDDGVLRHPSFKGEREDVAPEEVRWRPDQASDQGSGATGRDGPSGGERDALAADDEVAGVHLTHPDRILYPEAGLTKRGLALYYAEIAEFILPHVTNRPLALVRCPRGHTGDCFFQKHHKDTVPDAVHPVSIEGKSEAYLMIDSLAGLVSLVQMGTLEIHPWGARTDRLDRPDRVIFDLDPGPSVGWSRIMQAARRLHERLESLGLESFLKTTGGKGLHVVVPLVRRQGWDEVRAFAEALARELASEDPDRFTARMSKEKRKGRIFVDYLRNVRGATAVGAYSTRARPGAPVSVPVGWEELDEGLRPDRYTVANLPRRLARLDSDPWEGLSSIRQSITKRVRSELGLEGT